ncbi:MAG: hypothetical protein ACRC2T_20220 [Thermoguttaceae bacterium]
MLPSNNEIILPQTEKISSYPGEIFFGSVESAEKQGENGEKFFSR